MMRWFFLLSVWITACGSNSALSVLGASGGRVGAATAAGFGGSFGAGAGAGGISVTPSTAPPQKLVAKMITAPALGGVFACARLNDGTVRCWGGNGYGQLGNGTTTDSSVPVTVLGISTATFISAGSEPLDSRGHACAVLSDGTVQCWGFEAPGPAFERFDVIPVDMGISSATAVAAGGFHTCALMNDGTVQCWGDNSSGQFGNGTATDNCCSRGSVLNISTATAVAAGDTHSCALLHGGTVQCWGDNSLGQLGNGTMTNSWVPVTVLNISTATAIVAGSTDACALLRDRTVQCWGDRNAVPISVSGVSNAIAISPCCAVLSDGTVHCRGCLSSQVFMDAGTSVTISGINNAVAVADGFLFGIALLSDGTIQGWDEYGTLTDSISFN